MAPHCAQLTHQRQPPCNTTHLYAQPGPALGCDLHWGVRREAVGGRLSDQLGGGLKSGFNEQNDFGVGGGTLCRVSPAPVPEWREMA